MSEPIESRSPQPSPYRPQIAGPGDVRAAVAAIATEFGERVLADDALLARRVEAARWTRRFQSEEVLSAYTRCLPLVHRFVIAEFDCASPSVRGMARLFDGDPPPRVGAAYREQLSRPGARRVVGRAAERELLVGYLRVAAVADGSLTTPDLGSTWRHWLWRIATGELSVDRPRRSMSSFEDIDSWYRHFGLRIVLGQVAGIPMAVACEEVGIIEGWDPDRDGERIGTVLSNQHLLQRAGAALAECLLAATKARAPKRVTLQALEDYALPRSEAQLRQMV